jgi:hypothetical protein
MNTKWWSLSLRILPGLFAALMVSTSAFAVTIDHYHPNYPFHFFNAPEMDPALAIIGLTAAGAGAALIWEKVRRRR